MRAVNELQKDGMGQGAVPDATYWESFIPEQDAAGFLCQSVRTIQKWRVTGAGPQFYKFGRSVRYRRRDLARWVDERRRAHTSEA